MKKVIGITASADIFAAGDFPGLRRHVLNMPYGEAVLAAGAVPVILVRTDDVDAMRRQVALVDGILFSGGDDVAPSFFGEEPDAALGKVDRGRDVYEIALMRMAKAEQKPAFGICRGMQVMNVAFGGTLYQDLSRAGMECLQHRQKAAREESSHSITTVQGTWLAKNFDAPMVNSFHHQAVKSVAEGFVVNALSPDGVIEGIENREAPFMIGVQWHPEHRVREDASTMRLFRRFVEQL